VRNWLGRLDFLNSTASRAVLGVGTFYGLCYLLGPGMVFALCWVAAGLYTFLWRPFGGLPIRWPANRVTQRVSLLGWSLLHRRMPGAHEGSGAASEVGTEVES
jgi:hypothetical protein